jgi:hypothetical protein
MDPYDYLKPAIPLVWSPPEPKNAALHAIIATQYGGVCKLPRLQIMPPTWNFLRKCEVPFPGSDAEAEQCVPQEPGCLIIFRTLRGDGVSIAEAMHEALKFRLTGA